MWLVRYAFAVTDSETGVTEERLFSGYTGRVFIVLSVGMMAVKVGRYALPPLLPAVISSLSITEFEAGIALSAMTVGFAVMQFPGGRLSDKLSRKTILSVGLGMLLAGFLVLTITPLFFVFLLGCFLIGAGDGFYSPASMAYISDIFHEYRGRAFGLHMASIDLGGVLAAGLAVVVLARTSWRMAFVPITVCIVIVFVLLYYVSREGFVVERSSLKLVSTIRRLAGASRIRWILVVYTLYVFAWYGISGFLPTYLQAQGSSTEIASIAFAMLFGIGVVAKPLSGGLSDIFQRPMIGAASLGLSAVGVALLIFGSMEVLIIFGVVLYAIGHKSFAPVMQAYLMDIFADDSKGGDLGAVRTTYIGLGSVGPAYVGFVVGFANYQVAFFGFLICLLLGSGLNLWIALSE